MKTSNQRLRFKSLLQERNPGVPFTMDELRSKGISNQLAAYYVNSGWLRRVGQGLYCFPNETIEIQGVLSCFQKDVSCLHVASKTALAWNGVSHNLYHCAQSIVWGDKPRAIPAWVCRQFNVRYSCSRLFHFQSEKEDLDTRPLTSQFSDVVSCSCPERALLEMLYELPSLDVEEVENLFELVQYPRESVLAVLLRACKSLKVIRLFAQFSKSSGLLDVEAFYKEQGINTGSKSSWQVSLGRGKKITVKPLRNCLDFPQIVKDRT